MDDDITYIGISQESKENETKNKSKDAPPKKEKFKTQKKNKKVEKLIASTKNRKINKKLIIVLIIIILILYFKPITFLKNKLDEKRFMYSQYNSNYNSNIIDSLIYSSGIDYYKKCKNTLVLPADGLITCHYDLAHQGIDIACENYQDDIYAAANGNVCYIGYSEKYGNELMIEHQINGMTLYTFYGNLSSINVYLNEYVCQNQVIAKEGGNPQKRAEIMDHDGHHIHFEVRKSKTQHLTLNPTLLLIK